MVRAWRLTVFALLWAQPCAADPAASAAIPAALRPAPAVTLRPESVDPGGIAVVIVDDPTIAPERVSARFRGSRLAFFAGDDARARALVGVDLATPPGVHALAIEIRCGRRDGGRAPAAGRRDEGAKPVVGRAPPASRPLLVTRMLSVRAKEFPREDLTVEGKYVAPDARIRARIRREQARLDAVLAAPASGRLWHGAFLMPAEGPLGSPFGLRRYFNGEARRPHAGQDVRVPEGTPVVAAQSGRVVLTAPLFFSGNTVVLDHGLGLFTLYFHLASFRVRESTFVDRGALLGYSGKTGRVTGAHLHWAARLGGARVDPLLLARGPAAEDLDGRDLRH
jgi:hypothetical protein